MLPITVVEGALILKDQMKDYVDRGRDLDAVSYLDFFIDSYDGKPHIESGSRQGASSASKRSEYLAGTGRGAKSQVLRQKGHETLPSFIGRWFPRKDNPDNRPTYCAWMLAMLKPWGTLQDICEGGQTFQSSFLAFEASTTNRVRCIMANMQYFYECSDGAKKRKEDGVIDRHRTVVDVEDVIFHDSTDNAEDLHGPTQTYTQRDVEIALSRQFSREEQLFGNVGVTIGFESGFFKDKDTNSVEPMPFSKIATANDLRQFDTWDGIIKSINKRGDKSGIVNRTAEIEPTIDNSIGVHIGPDTEPDVQRLPPPNGILSAHIDILNTNQKMAHDIVTNHLRAYLDGRKPKQMLLNVMGPGGTGKSTMLNAITKTFEELGASDLLFKTALSGVAASLIGGTTLHWWAGIPAQRNPQSDDWMDSSSKEIRSRREKNIADIQCVAIDEVSMMTTDLVTLTSQVAGKVRSGNGDMNSTVPFGGLNVLLMGDFHQFEPVGKRQQALYSRGSSDDKRTSIIGRSLYHQFDNVVALDQQMRITDRTWQDILNRARTGDCTTSDLKDIQKLVLNIKGCDIPDFSKKPWSDAILVTPRNAVRSLWNVEATKKHCIASGNLLYRFDAEDTVGKHHTAPDFEQKTMIAGMALDDVNKLPHRVEIAIGMKIMITDNIATDADLANGSRGVIADIVLDIREVLDREQLKRDGYVKLECPPAAIIFEPIHYSFQKFPDLREGQIPIFPSQTSFNISTTGKPKTKITRRQYPITPAYAFTDHKAQGQTIEYVIVDIGKVPGGFGNSAFGMYVALSRSRGRNTIRLLRDFENSLFTRHPSDDLRMEDIRLEALAKETKEKWMSGIGLVYTIFSLGVR